MTRVRFQGRSLRLADADVIGTGGEARVFRHRDLALKVFHPIPKGLPKAERQLRRRGLEIKREKLESFPAGLPVAVKVPRDLVTGTGSDDGLVVGFAMDRVDGAVDIGLLARRTVRQGSVSNEDVMLLFRRIHGILRQIHAAGVVVGDLNDGNILVRDLQPSFIDTDSLQFAGLPCTVGHERYLDPRLYGADLMAAPRFDADTDWYAFGVLLVQTLLYIHPYGGVHRDHPTLLRRAQAGVSLLDPGVTRPRSAADPRVLPDPWMRWMRQVFEDGHRGPFPADLLDTTWSTCACGIETARSPCPGCGAGSGPTPHGLRPAVAATAPPAFPPPAPAAVHHGRCRAIELFRTPGRILAAVMQGALRYVHEHQGVARRENGEKVMEGTIPPGTRFEIGGDTTWIGQGARVVGIRQECVTERTNTQVVDGVPAFAATPSSLFRLEGAWLLDHARGVRHGKVLEAQTRLVTQDDGGGFGLYRVGALTMGISFDPRRPGVTEVPLPGPTGRFIDMTATFEGGRTLVTLATEDRGKRSHHMWLIAADGTILASITGSPENVRMLASVRGRVLRGDRVITATAGGLLLVQVNTSAKTFEEVVLFEDTQPFVDAGCGLLPGSGGSILVVAHQDITQLWLE